MALRKQQRKPARKLGIPLRTPDPSVLAHPTNNDEHFPGPMTTGWHRVRLVDHPLAVRFENMPLPDAERSFSLRIETPFKGWINRRPKGTGQWLLMYSLSGSGLIHGPEGASLCLRAREAVLFRPGTPQRYELDWQEGRWDYLWVLFTARPDWTDLLVWPEEWPGVMRLRIPKSKVSEAVLRRLYEVLRLEHQSLPETTRLMFNALEDFLLRCRFLICGASAPAADSRILRALDVIRERYTEADLDTAAVADALGLSPSRLEHLFREKTGYTPRFYIEQARFTHAKLLLAHSKKNISEIAAVSGISRADYFAARFRQLERCSPRQFRERHRSAHGWTGSEKE